MDPDEIPDTIIDAQTRHAAAWCRVGAAVWDALPYGAEAAGRMRAKADELESRIVQRKVALAVEIDAARS